MIVTFLTIMVLIALFYQIVASGSVDMAAAVTLFGSSGLVTLASVRVLKMFNDVLQEVFRRPAAASGTRAKRPSDTEIRP